VLKAIEVYNTQKRSEIDDYMAALKPFNERGKLGAWLLLAQRSQWQVQKVLAHEVVDPDYLRLKHLRNNFAIQRLIDYCVEHQAKLNLTIKFYKYGIRVTLRREAMIRFRRVEEEWRGDDANLAPICDYCDRMVHPHARTTHGATKRPGEVFTGHPAQ
jgi:hypothetical protein